MLAVVVDMGIRQGQGACRLGGALQGGDDGGTVRL
jgi:hypothetical protein